MPEIIPPEGVPVSYSFTAPVVPGSGDIRGIIVRLTTTAGAFSSQRPLIDIDPGVPWDLAFANGSNTNWRQVIYLRTPSTTPLQVNVTHQINSTLPVGAVVEASAFTASTTEDMFPYQDGAEHCTVESDSQTLGSVEVVSWTSWYNRDGGS